MKAEDEPLTTDENTAAPPMPRSTKGYSAEPGPLPKAPEEGPLPLAEIPGPTPPIHVPERDEGVEPTGRAEPGDYTPNDRLMGADR